MHELGIMSSVLEQTLQYAEENDVSKIRKITLEVGEYSGLIPELAQKYFSYISRGTIAEHASIEITEVPLTMKCCACGHIERASRSAMENGCSVCGCEEMMLTSSGRGWRLTSLEVL